MSLTDDARAEAEKLWTTDRDPFATLTYPPAALRAWARDGFLAGAEWAAAQTAQLSVEDVARVLRQNLIETVGDCVCGPAYTERDLVDPNCGWHLADGTADHDATRAVLALLPGTPVRELQEKAWDEACKAFAWCRDNGPIEQALGYVVEHNPYRADKEAGS